MVRMFFQVRDRKNGLSVINRRDVALGLGGLLVTMILYGFQGIGDVANMATWFTAGVCTWGWAFTVTGRLRPRGYVTDNVRDLSVVFIDTASFKYYSKSSSWLQRDCKISHVKFKLSRT